ncbi:alcohol dehydrogenase 3 [Quercus suber]|uniref:alcohol dehydrogenase n=1 Tax=Quercus suber TaxID=58331 RepID=A0AAW0KFC7_QUESU
MAFQTKVMLFKTHPMIFLNERTLKGTFFGNYKPRSYLPFVMKKIHDKLEKFITHGFPFSKSNRPLE